MHDGELRRLDTDDIDKCRLVVFVTDHIFDPVDENLIETFRTYFKRPEAQLHIIEPGEPPVRADEVGVDFIIHHVQETRTTFSLSGEVVTVSPVGKISADLA